MRWKRIKGYKHYLINDLGMVYSKYSDKFLTPEDRNGVLYIGLSNKGDTKVTQLARLVLDHFQPSQTVINTHAWHKDFELANVTNNNLKRCNLGDRRRMLNEIRGKKRGVYAWNIGKNKFRVVLKDPVGKTKTIGYYKTEVYATLRYIQA